MIKKTLKIIWIILGAIIILLNIIWRVKVMTQPAQGIGGIGVGIARGLIMALLFLILIAYAIITTIILIIKRRKPKQ